MTKTCFIIEELYPKDLGGIGRLMHNILLHSHSLDPGHSLHVVMPAQSGQNRKTLSDSFANIVTFHYVDHDENIARRLNIAGLSNAAASRNLTEPFLKGMGYLDAILQAEKKIGAKFDHIEIPDHLGLGAILLSAKKAGVAFAQTDITCRVHSTLSLIIDHEPFYHSRNNWLAPRLEMERQSLRDADRVIVHLPALAKCNQTHFNLPDTWLEKVEVAFPPAIWPETSVPISDTGKDADFIFTSRFQPFKRPELFIRAALTLLNSKSDFTGNFRLISYGFDQYYIDDLRLMVPARFRPRIRIETNLSENTRQSAISSGRVVQCSAFESLCTLAFEISKAGRPLLLAKDCLAFGETGIWQDGDNCLMFDPDPGSLAAAMEHSRHWQPKTIVKTASDAYYFHKPAISPAPHKAESKAAIFIGPLLNQPDFDGFADYYKENPSARAFASEANILRFAAKEQKNLIQLHPHKTQGQQLREYVALADGPVVIASPNTLPSAGFITSGLACISPGQIYTSNSKTVDGRLNIYPGNMPSILASDYRFAPLCVMLHSDDCNIIGKQDDRDLLPRLLTRIAKSDLDIIHNPLPQLLEIKPLIDVLPDRRILGFDPSPAWHNGVRTIGIDLKSARFNDFLVVKPVDLTGQIDPVIALLKDTDLAFQLTADPGYSDRILAINIRNSGADGVAKVSLHQTGTDAALERHKNGQQCRNIRAGQAYQMRWGPLFDDANLVLVVSSDQDTSLEINEISVISRE
ncbi:MAG: glycosyltransferase [Rhodobacteraceae bacterium]|nr:glycosyltransferase [Paracoccaceae bacterium]